MSLTITPSPFGSLTVSVAETNSTLSVTTVATSPAVLSMALGVPGPQGETGSQGPAGANGVGVPTGGSAGQVLAKIDGTNYNTEWVNAATGDFLPLSGGTMTAGALIDFTVTSGNDSEIGAWGFGVENTNGNVATVEPSQIQVYGLKANYDDPPINTTSTVTINKEGLTNSWEAITGGFAGFSLNAGGVGGNEDGGDANWHLNKNEVFGQGNNNDSPWSLDQTGVRGDNDGQVWEMGVNGLLFIDGTTQTTAGLPLTGGTVTGDVSLYNPSGSPVEMLFTNGDGFAVINHNTNQTLSLTYSGITFPDSSVQSTAFPPTGGTTSQYIDGTGALQTFPTVTTAGKMVTSFRNNTGATLAKGTVVYINGQVGNKPTVAKAQANAEATSKATYGFVETAVANNTDGNIVILGLLENIDTQGFSDGDLLYLSPTTAGAWTKTQPFSPYHYVRVGTVIRGGHPTQGSIAVQVTNGFQLDEMSDVGATAPSNANVLTWDSTASQWLDKSISTILGYTPLSSTTASAIYQTISGMSAYQSTSAMSAYLTSTTASATYQTQSGMSAYLSTSAAASTYQTQSGMSAYLSTASASANYIGTSAYATTAQAVTGSSASTVISPSTFLDGKFYAGGKYVTQITWTNATSGTGANAFAQNANARYVNAPTTATGYGIASALLANNSRGSIFNSGFDFSKRIVFGARFARNVTTVDANSIFRYSIGKSTSTDASDLSARGLMVKVAGGGAMQLLVHNGTTLTTTTSSFTPANGQAYDVVVVSDGSGNVTLYVNGSSVATSTGGPTSAGATNAYQLTFEVQNTATITSGQAQSICGSDFFVQVAP